MHGSAFDPTLLGRLGAAGGDRPGVLLRLHRGAGGDLAERLETAAAEVAAATRGLVEVVAGDGAGPPGVPALTVATVRRDLVHLMAAPSGREAAPFLELLTDVAGGQPRGCGTDAAARIRSPTELTVFIAADCPRCPELVRTVYRLVVREPRVTAAVIDAERFPDHARFFGVRSVPTLLVDDGLTVVGTPSLETLSRRIEEAVAPGGDLPVLESMLEAGRIADAGLRLAAGRHHRAFVELWRDSSLEGRIRLMLVAEEALSHARSCFDDLSGRLTASLETGDSGLRGDTVDLLGRIACRRAEASLRPLLQDPHPDVAEAAEEALAAIHRRRLDDD